MDILVALRQVVDPELPSRLFAIAQGTGRQVREGRPLVPSVYDMHALEVALQSKETHGGRIVAVTVGEASAMKVLRKALAMGADEAVYVDGKGLDDADPLAVAHVLAAVARSEQVSLVLCGCQSGDWGWEQTGPLVAEILDMPCVTFVSEISFGDCTLRLRRRAENRSEDLEVSLPAVVTVISSPGNLPRLPTIRAILEAEHRDIKVHTADAVLGGRITTAIRLPLEEVFVLTRREQCALIPGENPTELARGLAKHLQALGVL